jgi:hypothetical protein
MIYNEPYENKINNLIPQSDGKILIHILIVDTYRHGTSVQLFRSDKELFSEAAKELSKHELRQFKGYYSVTFGDEDMPSTMTYSTQEI